MNQYNLPWVALKGWNPISLLPYLRLQFPPSLVKAQQTLLEPKMLWTWKIHLSHIEIIKLEKNLTLCRIFLSLVHFQLFNPWSFHNFVIPGEMRLCIPVYQAWGCLFILKQPNHWRSFCNIEPNRKYIYITKSSLYRSSYGLHPWAGGVEMENSKSHSDFIFT